ncbi:MAG: gliding motility lipoprotein GldH [Bacteroidetes bacterium]|nr:gliding motility lipoprotein GldH [Bacteroidota bacterium]
MLTIEMIRKYSIRFISAASLLFFIVSCNNSVYYEDIKHINNSKWSSKDTLFFHFTITDTIQPYDFGVSVRNTTSYDYQNLYLFITATYPGGNWSRDTAECILAASDGKWYGKGMGKIKDSQFEFRKGVRFRKSGNYTIAVNQAMRQETLDGISDVGIRIMKASPPSR